MFAKKKTFEYNFLSDEYNCNAYLCHYMFYLLRIFIIVYLKSSIVNTCWTSSLETKRPIESSISNKKNVNEKTFNRPFWILRACLVHISKLSISSLISQNSISSNTQNWKLLVWFITQNRVSHSHNTTLSLLFVEPTACIVQNGHCSLPRVI